MALYYTKIQPGTLRVTQPSPNGGLPTNGMTFHLNIWKCVVSTDSTPDPDGTFPPSASLVVMSMTLRKDKHGSNEGWSMGFTTTGDQPVQVGSGGGVDEE